MARRCKVCGTSKETVQSLVLFQAPDALKRRIQWSKACGISVTKSTLICQQHFRSSDVLGSDNRLRLKSTALPTAFLYCEPESSKEPSKKEKNMLTTEIKSEPTDNCLSSTELNIKEEPSDTYEPMILIHEAYFDANNVSPMTTILGNQNSTKTKMETNSKQKSIIQRKICGRIDRESNKDGNNMLILICNVCDQESEISRWEDFQNFHEHIKEHQEKTEICENPEAKENHQTKTFSDDCDKDIDNTKSLDENNTNGEYIKEVSNFSEKSEVDLSNNELEEDEQIKDEDYEPKSKKLRRGRPSKNKEENSISFSTPNKQCVINFLELVKSNAILWHRRQSIMKRFDATMGEVILIFNAKWPNHAMTEEQSRLSITKIKDLYKRISYPNHKRHMNNSMLQEKYSEYLKLCAEIEENSKKVVHSCDRCLASFFNELDLQVHKVKLHQIGELPFKCKYCKYGFAKAETLAEHELKHERTNQFICEVCNKGFHSEKLLKAHSVVHDKKICEICGKSFATQDSFRLHKIYHKAPQNKCEQCGKNFFTKRDLSDHMKIHENKRDYECEICGKGFNHQRALNIHKRGVHNTKQKSKNISFVNNSPMSSDSDTNDDDTSSINPLRANTTTAYADDIARNQQYLGELFSNLQRQHRNVEL